MARTVEQIMADLDAAEIDWDQWGYCKTCGATRGVFCAALSGRVAGGRPDGKLTPLPRPHAARSRLRAAGT